MKMKICYIANADSIHTQRWVMGLSDLGYDLTVISPKSPKNNVLGNRVINLSSIGNQNLNYVKIVTKIKSIVDRIEPDIVHAHYATGYGFLGRMCKYHPLIISVWGSDVFEFPNKSWLHRSLLESNLQSADIVLSTSKIMAAETRKYIPINKPIKITPFGIDTELFSPTKSRNGEPEYLTIGVIKTLENIYGIDILIEAFLLLSQQYSNLKLLIIGNGSQLSPLQQRVNILELAAKVKFLPAIPHHLVPEYLAKIDIFVMPSRQESFGVAVLEASACGLPVVASDVGGLPEVIADGVTGFLVPPEQPQIMAEKISQLIESPALRKSMGEHGRDFVEKNYKWSDSLDKMSDIYRSLAT
jgi:L-malate glycosyltransferase